MSKLWHLQHNIKILKPNITGFKRNLYLYDFIDEKSRFGLAYLSENKSQSSAIGIFNQAYDDFFNKMRKLKYFIKTEINFFNIFLVILKILMNYEN